MAVQFYEGKLFRIKVAGKTIFHETDFKLSSSLDFKELASKDLSSKQRTPGDLDWNISCSSLIGNRALAAIITPVNAAFTAGAGTLAAATYYYRVSALNANGETLPSTETSFAAAANTGVNVNWGAVTGATGYKVYGRSTGAELLIATVGTVTTYLDNGSITPAGAMPTVNSTLSGQEDAATLYAKHIAKEPVSIEFTTGATGDMVFTGQAFVSQFDLDATTDDVAKGSFSFVGNGDLALGVVV